MMTFFREWLHLPKSDFRILAMLADEGNFEGSLSDLCRCFSLDTQTRNRNKLKASIQHLSASGFIVHKENGQRHQLSLIPQEQGIAFPRSWYKILKQHDNTSESVSWEAVMKVIADGLGRQLPHLTIKTVLLNRIRKVQTKTPFLLLLTVGKRG